VIDEVLKAPGSGDTVAATCCGESRHGATTQPAEYIANPQGSDPGKLFSPDREAPRASFTLYNSGNQTDQGLCRRGGRVPGALFTLGQGRRTPRSMRP